MAGETRPGAERSASAKHSHPTASGGQSKPRSPAAVSRSRAARLLPNCYVCGARGADTTLRSRPHASDPFFPFLQYHDASPGTVFRPDGTVDCCQVCHAFLKQQWLAYESTNTPIVKRLYWLKRSDGGGGSHGSKPDPQMQVSPQVREEMYKLNIRDAHYSDAGASSAISVGTENSRQDNGFSVSTETADHKRRISFDSVDVDIPAVTVCYGCGSTTSKQSTRVVHTSHWSKSEAPYFPCILGHPAPPGAKPVDNLGRVLMCELCTSFLLRQWYSFERDSVPLHQRKYHLRSETDPSPDSVSGAPNHIICFLCGKAVTLSDTHLIRARRFNSSEPYYPFLDKHAPPTGSAPLSKEGLAQVCLTCSKDLYEQWNAHELTHTPHDKRVYRIHKAKKQNRPHTNVEPGLLKQAEKRPRLHICYLCAQTVPSEHTKMVDTLAPDKNNGHVMYFPFLINMKKPSQAKPIDVDGRALVCSNCYLELEQQWKVYQAEGIPHSERRYVGKTKLGSPTDTRQFTKGVCYLCGAHCDPNRLYKVHSYPRRSTDSIDETTPFFPFLASRNPAASAAPIDTDGTALSCMFCYFNLIAQWQDFEDSTAFADSNRWLRHYFVHEFACFICGHLTARDDVRTVRTKEYPSLLGIERPRAAVVLENGNIVFTCSTCELSLIRQRRTFEHMQVPEGHRQYQLNRTSSSGREGPISNSSERKPGEGRNESVIVIDSDSEGEREHASLRRHGNPDSVQSSLSPKSGSSSSRPASEGAPSHGAKPPPLTVVTSSSSKATRTTATVNPLNQSASTVTVTSANSTNHAMAATRTSSFAAALRKLAKHANDNGPEEHSPRVSPVSMNRSSASTPSKNFHFGPSPLVVPTSTPPVVTIAPTHTNNSSIMSEQRRLSQELDRHGHHNSSEQHNSSRHATEAGSIQNSIWRSKGSPGGGPRRPVPHHLKPEETTPVRGFQPYRSGETEMTPRPPAPAPPPPPPPPPSHLTYDPAMMAAALSPYPFHQAFMGPPHMPYHGFRPEDSYERYSSYPGLRPPPFIPFSSPPSHLFPHPAMNPLAFSGLRYPSDLAAMQLSHLSPGVSFGGLVSPTAQHEREKLLLDQQRDRERRAEEAKQEAAAAQKEKQQQQQQRETERENHDRAIPSRSQEDKRSSPRDGSHLRPPHAHHHNHHHHHHQQVAHSQHHTGSSRVPPSSSSSSSSSGHRDEQGPLPLLKKAEGDDRWQSKHMKDNSSNDGQYRHVRNSQAMPHENHISHTSEKERKLSLLQERELLLQQDRRIAERHEKERNMRELHNQLRGEHHRSNRPPPLVSPVRPTQEEIYRHKLFNNHRPVSQENIIPPQFYDERLNSVDRILLNDKSSVSASAAATTSAAEKAWYEQHRTMIGNRTQSPHASTSNHTREFDREARIVTNSHGSPAITPQSKSSHLSQYDYDRPHAEFNYHWKEFNRINQQVRELQNHSGDQPRVQLNENGEPVVSKLDLEGRRRIETRANGIYISSESESDSEEDTELKRERYRKRMHRIVRKSCMTLDDSEKKTSFFQAMGLVTHGKKEEINEEKRRKRRIWLKEDQPPPKIRRPSSEPASLLPSPANLSQEDFQRELDYPHKCRFLRGLGLDVVSRDKRKEMEKARTAVEAYQARRAKRKEEASGKETLRKEAETSAAGSETAQTPAAPTSSGTDLKVESLENKQCKTAVGETFPNHLVSSPGLQSHIQNERTLLSGGSGTPQLKNPEKVLHSSQGRQLLSDKDIKQEPSAGTERPDLPRCGKSGTDTQGAGGILPFSTAALLSRGSAGGTKPSQFEGFAQEFHQSVLRTTQEAMAHQRLGPSPHAANLAQVDSLRRDRHTIVGLTNTNSEGAGPPRSNAAVCSKGLLQWPGVEVVMDSYQRHAKEQELERSVLLDQQGRLRLCNGELNSTAEQLRLKMADLMERKQLLHRDQEAYLRDLHHLQKCLHDMRK